MDATNGLKTLYDAHNPPTENPEEPRKAHG